MNTSTQFCTYLQKKKKEKYILIFACDTVGTHNALSDGNKHVVMNPVSLPVFVTSICFHSGENLIHLLPDNTYLLTAPHLEKWSLKTIIGCLDKTIVEGKIWGNIKIMILVGYL